MNTPTNMNPDGPGAPALQALSANPPLPGRRWNLTAASRYLFAEWDGQSVLYHTGSGDTRWVSTLARMVLERLRDGPLDRAGMFEALRPAVQESDLAWLDDALGETLQDLYELDLLEHA